ncbi:peptidase A24 [Kocuria flava]|uniref:Peptidase A24 n=1 Tax=Kocuria flava TaxID=446860 RepID=A0A0U3HXB4_9MICC|nr:MULTISPECIES: peptidase A24 [Kocuria]ALU39559.1 peptidase A24 [Kocuria flava]MCD1144867.1 peptidase A24 [Kocuria sp. LUK]PLC13298.1 peptidase A24 [Kocuria flava]
MPSVTAFLGEQFARGDAAGWAAGVLAAAAFALLAGAGVWLGAVDVREHRLPGRVVRPLYPACGLPLAAAAVLGGEPVRLLWMLWGLVLVGGAYVLLRLLSPAGLGLGDVRLSGLLGLCLGFVSVGHAVLGALAGFVAGGLAAAVLLVAGRAGPRTRIAFGPAMLAGALAVLVLG